jgi:solute carrier family 6 amino acid/orphan transporter-like 15/16/17/18/20
MGIQIMHKEDAAWFPADDLRDFHGIVAHEPTALERTLFGFREDGTEGICFPRKHGPEQDDDDEGLT